MGLSQHTNMTIPGTLASGLSKQPTSGRLPPRISGRGATTTVPLAPKKRVLPTVLAYPRMHPLEVCEKHLKDHLCYFIRHYGNEGLSVLISRDPKKDEVAVLCGDWKGNNIDLSADSTDRIVQAGLVFLQEDLKLFMNVMHTIKLTQAQFFLALDAGNQLTLTDIQVAYNKLVGPGMVRDIFGKVYRTQEVIKVEALDDRSIEYVGKGTGSYEGDLLIKPSKFTTFSPTAEDEIIPLYVEVRR